jgi:predicted dehydrogenase
LTQPGRHPSALALTHFGTILDVVEHTVLLTLAVCKRLAFVDSDSAAGWPPLPTDRLELIGERASIIFENDVLKLLGEQEESVHFDMEAAYQVSYDNAIAHFVEALRTGKPFETDRLDNLQTLRLVEEAYRKAGL